MQKRDGYLRVIAIVVLASCGTAPTLPEARPAQYTATFLLGLTAGMREGCVRYVNNARLALDASAAGSFDLSIGIAQDCTRGGGGGITAWEARVVGQYRPFAGSLRFMPADQDTPDFIGRHTNGTLRLVLPIRTDSLAFVPVTAELGTPAPLPTPRALDRVGPARRRRPTCASPVAIASSPGPTPSWRSTAC
jgi:hypothetical protein